MALSQFERNKLWYERHCYENAARCLAYYRAHKEKINARRRKRAKLKRKASTHATK